MCADTVAGTVAVNIEVSTYGVISVIAVNTTGIPVFLNVVSCLLSSLVSPPLTVLFYIYFG